MATGTLISVEEYLGASYRPDRDYVDGEIRERNWGDRDHSGAHGETIFYLTSRYPQLRGRVLPGLRVRTGATRVRVPDVCILSEHARA